MVSYGWCVHKKCDTMFPRERTDCNIAETNRNTEIEKEIEGEKGTPASAAYGKFSCVGCSKSPFCGLAARNHLALQAICVRQVFRNLAILFLWDNV